MATCRDCFHWEACKTMFEASGGIIADDDFKGGDVRCKNLVSAADVAPRAEWISADNPPKTYRDEYGELIPFIVCCRGTVYPFRAMYDGKNWGDGIGRLNVTHWMPLPEPPDMKGGAE